MVDEQTGRVVDTKHTGRGYELSKGHYVPIDDDELKAVEIETTHTVDITGFVPPSCPSDRDAGRTRRGQSGRRLVVGVPVLHEKA
jgi:Ku70/Ku80 beta-barrel domain